MGCLRPELEAVVASALALSASLERGGERRLLLLEGRRDWGLSAGRAVARALTPVRVTWITNQPPRGAVGVLSPAKAAGLLGGECDLLIIDVHDGLDADALGAAAGTLRGGGLLLLLGPPLEQWPDIEDAQAGRIAVHGYKPSDVASGFIGRLARLLRDSPAVRGYRETRPPARAERPQMCLPTGTGVAVPNRQDAGGVAATPDQQRAIEAICQLAHSRARRPLVLTADRGRGKSAALGIAAALLLREAPRRLIVTAPRRHATEALFEHARLGGADADAMLRFVPPDALLRERPAADLLLVDEAAGIPAPLLAGLLEHYARICFATTVHGYEGTGRGFEVRFRAVLDRRTPNWRGLRLETPIRWVQGDPLERLIDDSLLLDAEPAPAAEIIARLIECGPAGIVCERLDRDRLAADDALLRQVFGLLVLGHYQTRPADLRLMLDAPNIEVIVLRVAPRQPREPVPSAECEGSSGDQSGASITGPILATALVGAEGRLEADLTEPIFAGRRRPHGHLLPQTLSAHGGLFDAPRLAYARILRIAVHPAAQRRGFGRRLVMAVRQQARADGLDLVGASFGATADLLAFWRHCGLEPVHSGSRRNAASGAHAAVVLSPVSLAGEKLVAVARRRLLPRLAVLLGGPLRDLEPPVVAELLVGAPNTEPDLELAEERELIAFATASRGLESVLPALQRLARLRLSSALGGRRIEANQASALILCVLQQHDPVIASRRLGLGGKAVTLRLLRRAAAALLAGAG